MKIFILIIGIQLCSAFSSATISVALMSILFNNQGSISILMMVMAMPTIFFSKKIGNLLDKSKKGGIKLVVFMISIQLISTIVVMFSGVHNINFFVYMYAFLTSIVFIFIELLLQISVTLIAKEQQYLKMNSILSLVENAGIIVGPILGGYFAYQNNDFGVFGVILLSFVFMFLFSILLNVSKLSFKDNKDNKDKNEPLDNPQHEEQTTNEPKGLLFKQQLRKIYYMIAIFGFAISIINIMQISFVINYYNTNELGFGLTESAWGAGMAAGAFFILLLTRCFAIILYLE